MRSEIEFMINESSDPGHESADPLAHAEPDDEIMDAYSRAVITAAEKVSPSDVYIEVHQPARSGRGNAPRMPQETRGSGSGFIFPPDASIPAKTHTATLPIK